MFLYPKVESDSEGCDIIRPFSKRTQPMIHSEDKETNSDIAILFFHFGKNLERYIKKKY